MKNVYRLNVRFDCADNKPVAGFSVKGIEKFRRLAFHRVIQIKPHIESIDVFHLAASAFSWIPARYS